MVKGGLSKPPLLLVDVLLLDDPVLEDVELPFEPLELDVLELDVLVLLELVLLFEVLLVVELEVLEAEGLPPPPQAIKATQLTLSSVSLKNVCVQAMRIEPYLYDNLVRGRILFMCQYVYK